MEYRICRICGDSKELSDQFFYKRGNGFRWECKVCALQNRKEHYPNIKEDRSVYIRQYYRENKDELKEQQKEYQLENKEILSLYRKEYYQDNKDNIIVKNREAAKVRRKIDPVFRFRRDISTSIWRALKKYGGSKDASILKNLAYSMQELKEHLEKQFEPWMSWQNHGKYNATNWIDSDPTTWTWNIDHIIPQSKLPYTSMFDENFQKCWSLENLRPLSSKQNIIDGDR